MKTIKKIVFIVSIFLCFTSCNLIYGNKTRIVKTDLTSKVFLISKGTPLVIESISVLDRLSRDWPYGKFNRAIIKVNDTLDYFNEIVEGIKALQSTYNIKFKNEANIVNDSLFKPLLEDLRFTYGFHFDQMKTSDFTNKEDGLHLIVTIIREYGCVQGYQVGCVYEISFVYDFFLVKNGELSQETTILRKRNANHPENKKRWKPIPRDTRRVFKKLYKLSDK
jgi:hypothetical protein